MTRLRKCSGLLQVAPVICPSRAQTIPQCVQIRCLTYKHDESLGNQLRQWQSEIIARQDEPRMTCTSIKLSRCIAHSEWYAFEVRDSQGCGRRCLVHLTVLGY